MTTAQDGGKVVTLTHRPPLPLGNTPGAHLCSSLSRPQGHSATGRIMSLKNSNETVGNRTRDPPRKKDKTVNFLCSCLCTNNFDFS